MSDRDKIFEDIAEYLPQIVWTASPDGTVTYYNQRWWEFTGFKQEEGLGSGWKIVLHPDDEQPTIDAWNYSVRTGEPYEIEHRIVTSDGKYKWVLSKGVPVKNEKGEIVKWYGSATDINKLKDTEAKLKISREKNELLMKEVVHRTKNTLQLVDSLVSLQMDMHGNDETAVTLRSLHSRIKSISLLHRKLNISESIDHINIKTYLEDLIELITAIFKQLPVNYEIRSEISSADVPVNTAINIGLITNELVTNSFKHAFKDVQHGIITISLSGNDEKLLLHIGDNGRGTGKSSEENSLGLQIVKSLVDQNGGEIHMKNSNGRHYSITFNL